jgi:hypothetical protein
MVVEMVDFLAPVGATIDNHTVAAIQTELASQIAYYFP